MGSCTRRHFMLSICFLQMITIFERQVFDFLGYMWAPIFVNFFHIIFIILGFYGAYHFRIKYIITYLIWNFLWIGWNAFLICFYLDVGTLDKESDLLNLGTGSFSWFEENSYGCKPTYSNITSTDPSRPERPESVDGCLVDYTLIEVIHSSVQCLLALLGIIGAILISYIFLDEDDRFDFMNGDAKSPQHTVVHPMYVSYSSIPTSASATLLSNKHHQHLQQQQQQQHYNHNNHQQQQHANNNYNNNTFLIHTNNSSYKRSNSNNSSHSNNNNNTPNASKNNTLTRMLYNTKNNKIASSTTSITRLPSTTTAPTALAQQSHQMALPEQYYDDSTAKADQMFTNSNRRQLSITNAPPQTRAATSSYPHHQQQQNVVVLTPNSSHDNTTSSLSYASLQNSNLNLRSAYSAAAVGGGGSASMGMSVGGGDTSIISSPMSNSNYSLSNSINNNTYTTSHMDTTNSGRFARIHTKPKTPKSTSYSSFINGVGVGVGSTTGSGTNLHRPDIKYTQMSSERLSSNFDEGLEDDNFSLQNFKTDDAITYIPFKKPTPGNLFISPNNNASYASLNSYMPTHNSINNNASPNNNSNFHIHDQERAYATGPSAMPHLPRDNSQAFMNGNAEILLENGAVLHPVSMQDPALQQAFVNPAMQRLIYQRNGLPINPAYSPTPFRAHPTRPTNIPLPTIPTNSFDTPISPSEVTPPPPPAPRPHIFQPRSGNAPYPDLSPDVAEKYSMPTQYVPRSPIASRIARRQRQQQQHERSHLANTSANFCDQIRDAPPGYIDTGFNIVRAKSHDRLTSNSSSLREASKPNSKELVAPHVNRRSGRRDANGKTRPRSYCNSMVGGEGVIRANISNDRGYDGNGAAGIANHAGVEYAT